MHQTNKQSFANPLTIIQTEANKALTSVGNTDWASDTSRRSMRNGLLDQIGIIEQQTDTLRRLATEAKEEQSIGA